MAPVLSARAEKVARILKTRFDHDGRYFLDAYVGSGIQADVFRIKKHGSDIPGPDRVAVKVPAMPELRTAKSEMIPEKEALRLFSGAMHVVQILDMRENVVGADPLSRDIKDAPMMPVSGWMYLEWLDNGTLHSFLQKARDVERPVPNRLLWRIFMCYIRMITAMAWSKVHVSGTHQLEEIQSNIPDMIHFNSDMHSQNMVFGDFDPNSPHLEHRLSPMLKMIDLGYIARKKTANEAIWKHNVGELIWQVGNEMKTIVLAGARISLEDKNLDSDLIKIVRWCEDPSSSKRPSLQDLHEWVGRAITGRDADWYKKEMPDPWANSLEEDDAVRQYVVELIVNASTEEAKGP
ncbi:hypothetical protein PFICI_12137 [Pestalotiopsis fici W106-1]|uniref:Protein kinase domain-containing protein n=1 Tax=Pestalotiopsis fici (strain W106-1 / CGMCC3.15140) TaxID=1229662 RepID=W3WSC2_PESFW|nr:uncharacterized protein PFICI_12137 [Pestalotiopsis fici W106-1]ETS76750.1 hypothetical protein PFICI_12137 [Pestalotiopsis fici W106-1]